MAPKKRDAAFAVANASTGPSGSGCAWARAGAAGVAVPRSVSGATLAEVQAQAGSLTAPLALKGLGFAHKTEAGGVVLCIEGAAHARETFAKIMASAAAYAPKARLDGVLVQEMISGGVEALLGLVDHAPFGLGLVVGAGGTLTELMQDAAFDLLPITPERAEAMLSRTRLSALLAGARGAAPADRAALVRAMVALSDFGVTHGAAIEAVDLNPVAVLPEGRGLRLLDALVLRR